VILKVWGELTFAEIAEALEIPVNTAAFAISLRAGRIATAHQEQFAVTDIEQEPFEAELRRTRPGSLPEGLRSRLLAATGPTKASPVALGPAPAVMGLQWVLRLLIRPQPSRC